jgi:hypothetical protein
MGQVTFGNDHHFLWETYKKLWKNYGKHGKHTKNYGKSPFFLMGKLTINGHFQ